VLLGGLVHFVETFGLEKEVAGLTADHGYQPANEGGGSRVLEDEGICGQKADRTQQVEGLVNTAVVVVAVIVPPLDS